MDTFSLSYKDRKSLNKILHSKCGKIQTSRLNLVDKIDTSETQGPNFTQEERKVVYRLNNFHTKLFGDYKTKKNKEFEGKNYEKDKDRIVKEKVFRFKHNTMDYGDDRIRILKFFCLSLVLSTVITIYQASKDKKFLANYRATPKRHKKKRYDNRNMFTGTMMETIRGENDVPKYASNMIYYLAIKFPFKILFMSTVMTLLYTYLITPNFQYVKRNILNVYDIMPIQNLIHKIDGNSLITKDKLDPYFTSFKPTIATKEDNKMLSGSTSKLSTDGTN